jgi:thiol-disulfide isomerase/thioredoxin
MQWLKRFTWKFWLTALGEILFVVTIFMALSYWQESDMLTADSNVPVLTAVALDGKQYRFPEQQQTAEHTLIYFFAPWCKICHISIGNLNILRNQISAEQINILIVALDWQSKAEIVDYMAEHDLEFPVLLGDQAWRDQYKIKGFPSYYIVDRNGTVISKSMGYSSSVGMIARVLAFTGG